MTEELKTKSELITCFMYWKFRVWDSDFTESDLLDLQNQINFFELKPLNTTSNTLTMINDIKNIVKSESYMCLKIQADNFIEFSELIEKNFHLLNQHTILFIDGILDAIKRKLTY